jgi:hypothetical protein
MSRRCTSAQRSLFVCAAVAVGIAFSGAAPASAASGSPPPKPQVLWHAYPLDSTKTPARKVHATRPRGTGPASAPAGDRTAAPRGGGTLSTRHLAALAALAAGAVGVLVLLMRRRALTESVAPSSNARVDHGERIEPQPEPPRGQARPSDEEKAALKRTSASADAEAAAKLKAKGHASEAPKDARERDLTALKAKLGHSAAAKRTRAAPRPRTPPARCHIEWRPNGDQTAFCALGSSASREETALLSSPPFAWTEDVPPSKDLPEAGSAYRALVSELVADGWVATGIGMHWYEVEFERTAQNIRTANRQKGRT